MQLNFSLSRIPEIYFGAGEIKSLPDLILRYGTTIILITGSASFRNSESYESLLKSLKEKSVRFFHKEIYREPTPEDINSICREFSDTSIDVIVSVGGGSVLDAGKAISAMINKKDPVEEYLEGVGIKDHDGSKIPFIAVPTTAGTGSEATKNAVLSKLGEKGFKKSLRHINFIPDIALVDPELSLSCPPDVTAACGMDAFTQLLESYVSTNASPITDSLAYSGIKLMKDHLVQAVTSSTNDIESRAAMSYGALLSGITLANAGLGIVHGLASPIGSYYEIPHGVVCGTLIGVATRINIERLREDEELNRSHLEKYAKIGRLLSDNICLDMNACCDYLLNHLDKWTELLKIPKLSDYGFQESDVEKVVNETGQKNNPVMLTDEDIVRIVRERF